MAYSTYTDDNDYKDYVLCPAVYERLDEFFPLMHFRRRGNRWESNYHFNGDKDSSGKFSTYVYENNPCFILDKARGNKELVKYYQETKGLPTYRDAIEELSSKCGLTPPNYNSEEYKERRARQDSRTAALEAFTSALWQDTPEAKQALDYLHSRNWTDEEIRAGALGLVTTAILNTLADTSELHSTVRDEHDRVIGGIGTTHTLAIPYRSGSRLLGFKIREARKTPVTRQKYLNTYGLEKKSSLFGIGTGVKDLTIVESELDTLHAQVKGFPSIAATAGGAATASQLQDAIRRGTKRITLLYDNDEAGRSFILKVNEDERGNERETGTLPTCEALGLPTYVAFLPDGVKDVDEYFQKGHSIEELSELVDNAVTSYLFRYSLLRDKYGKTGGLTLKERDEFFSKFEKIINSPLMIGGDEGNRELLYRQLEEDNAEELGKGIKDFRAYLDKQYNLQVANKQKEEALQAATKIDTLLKEGKVDEALRLMAETGESVPRLNKAAEYAKVFAPPSERELDEMIANLPKGLPTGYCFLDGSKREALTLNVGLTFICGLRGHGKTTFLNNIAINEAKRQLHIKANGGKAKSVLYFSYEINKGILVKSLLNTFVNDASLSKSPLDTIQSYFEEKTKGAEREDKARYFKGQGEKRIGEKNHYDDFVTKQTDFWRNYLKSGLLTIVDEPYLVENLLEAIKSHLAARPVSLICIDYAQQIYSESEKSKARYEEIKKIVNDIKNFAYREKLPFVLAAQFNRKDVKSPVSVDTTSIGEGGDFERIADTCIGIYNLKELHLPKDDTERKELKDFLTKNKTEINNLAKLQDPEAKQLPDTIENPLPQIQGVIYARLMKRRYGVFPLDTFLQWEGTTGYIKQNDEAHFLIDPTEAALFKEERTLIKGTD